MRLPGLAGVVNGKVHRRRVAYHILLAALASRAALSQAPPASHASTKFFEEPGWQSVCFKALAAPLPPAADALARSVAAKPALAAGECDEHKLYYGFGARPDYPAALQCAYRHRAYPDGRKTTFLEGPGTLAMLYANGDGVPRDYPRSRFVLLARLHIQVARTRKSESQCLKRCAMASCLPGITSIFAMSR